MRVNSNSAYAQASSSSNPRESIHALADAASKDPKIEQAVERHLAASRPEEVLQVDQTITDRARMDQEMKRMNQEVNEWNLVIDAIKLIKCRESDQAIDLVMVRVTTDRGIRERAFREIALEMAKLGGFDRATELVMSDGLIPDQMTREIALGWIATEMVRQGKVDRAISLVTEEIRNPTSKSDAISLMIAALMDSRDYKRAIELAASELKTDPRAMEGCLIYIVMKMVQQKAFEQAVEQVDQKIADQEVKTRVLAVITQELAKRGKFDRA